MLNDIVVENFFEIDRTKMFIITVYENNINNEVIYSARLSYVIDGENIPTNKIIVGKDLSVIRNKLKYIQLCKICRQKNDSPEIIECWI